MYSRIVIVLSFHVVVSYVFNRIGLRELTIINLGFNTFEFNDSDDTTLIVRSMIPCYDNN